jgi:hypothetical protein
MNESRLRTIEQLQEFVEATPQVQFSAHGGDGDSQRYQHISAVLRRFDYSGCSKADRGVVRAYLVRTTGYSRAQLTRLLSRWGKNRLSAVPLAKCNRWFCRDSVIRPTKAARPTPIRKPASRTGLSSW